MDEFAKTVVFAISEKPSTVTSERFIGVSFLFEFQRVTLS